MKKDKTATNRVPAQNFLSRLEYENLFKKKYSNKHIPEQNAKVRDVVLEVVRWKKKEPLRCFLWYTDPGQPFPLERVTFKTFFELPTTNYEKDLFDEILAYLNSPKPKTLRVKAILTLTSYRCYFNGHTDVFEPPY